MKQVLLVALVLLASPALAQSDSTPRAPRLDFPLLDAPYNLEHGGRAPSMQQALAVTEGFYEASHLGIQRVWGDQKLLAKLSILTWDLLTIAVPGADAWVHEEYHRAVLGRRGIASHNDVYALDLSAEAIAVSHVRDEDLVRLKRDHPAEQVRLSSAGMEAELHLVQELERNRFFGRSRAWNLPTYWLVKLGTAGYLFSGSDAEVDADIDEFNDRDGDDVDARDFTGHDFTAWVYDLHRPDEAYTARGTHPSGVGIDRYIKTTDLTPDELKYLERQSVLHALNFLDPFMYGINGIRATNPLNGRPMRVNARAGHMLTPFGHTVDANLLLRQGALNLSVALRGYANGERSFPGIEAEVLDYPLRGTRLTVSPRLALWMQPEGQRFRSTRGVPGALASVRVHRPLDRRFGTFAELEGKSAGWVLGNANLDAGFSFRVGGSVMLR
ncbi:MAG TPA: hypothetical protein VF613_12560 [Longimicrobium sp.]|jgi:hypothetical protein